MRKKRDEGRTSRHSENERPLKNMGRRWEKIRSHHSERKGVQFNCSLYEYREEEGYHMLALVGKRVLATTCL